jgi:glucose-6-phosphate 1-epimerase
MAAGWGAGIACTASQPPANSTMAALPAASSLYERPLAPFTDRPSASSSATTQITTPLFGCFSVRIVPPLPDLARRGRDHPPLQGASAAVSGYSRRRGREVEKMRAAELTAEFGVAGILAFGETSGLVKAAISLDGIAGEVYLQGAQVTGWQPAGGRPVLFLSPNSVFLSGRAIRGGIPIIFPWFGPNRHAPAAPQHGFARTATWHLESVETVRRERLTLNFSLGDGDVASPFWPQAFRAACTIVFAQTLSLRLAVQNRARHPILFEEALHSYFAISDIAGIAISGLASTTYIDKTSAGQRKEQGAARVTIVAETDRVYLDTPRQCMVEDAEWRRRIVIEKDGAASSVVWNPWAEKAAGMADLGDPAWRGMICVEAGNIADNEVRLAADAEHAMSISVSVEPSSQAMPR